MGGSWKDTYPDALRRVEVYAVLGIFNILRRIERRVSFILCYEYIIRDEGVEVNMPLIRRYKAKEKRSS